MLQQSTVTTNRDRRPTSQTYNQLRSLMPRLQEPLIIAITGNRMVGKSSYIELLSKILGSDLVACVDLHNYYLKHFTAQPSIETLDPACYDLDRAAEDLQTLKQGKSITFSQEMDGFEGVVQPKPIICVQGLHSLDPLLLPAVDFGIFLGTTYQLIWNYHFDRYVTQGGMDVSDLEDYMLAQDKAYKDWIEPQQKNAQLLALAAPSSLQDFAGPHLLDGSILPNCPKMQLILDPLALASASLSLLLNLGQVLTLDHNPVMFAVVPSIFWGKKVVRMHIDGFFSRDCIRDLTQHIQSFSTGPTSTNHLLDDIFEISAVSPLGLDTPNVLCATDLGRLLVVWRVLEEINHLVLSRLESGTLKLHSGPFAGLDI